jgi:glycosyltransferase involved in cell wall biosynthesis
MQITILSTFDTQGGAAIAASRLNRALNNNGLTSNVLVQDKKSKDVTTQSIANTWFQKKLALARFALDRLQFVFYEKSKEVRFSFSQATVGVDVSTHPLILQSDVIHLHWINFGFLSLNSIDDLIKTNKPIVWTLHDMWAFTGGCHYSGDCENYLNSCGNCVPFLKNPSDADLSNQVWQRKAEIFKKSNFTVVACSEWLAQKARQSSLLRGKTILSIPNPIDVNVFQPTPKDVAAISFQLAYDKNYILFAAAKISDERKGFSYFKEALSVISNQLLINGKTTSDIEILIFGQAQVSDFEELPFKVNILGKLSNLETIAKAYSAATVFVSPSIEDNLPNTIMESMACGTPVVGFEVGGIPEMINHKINGYLAQYKSVEDLAKGIYWTLFESDYQALVTHSRQKVLDNYSEKVIAERYKKVYESLV